MAITTTVVCDGGDCEKYAIYAIVGNVHFIDSQEPECVGGGLVGNNLEIPENLEDTPTSGQQ